MTLKKFREAFVLSRAKDDVKNALYLARLLLTHYTELTPWQPEEPATRLLQQLEKNNGVESKYLTYAVSFSPHIAAGRHPFSTPGQTA